MIHTVGRTVRLILITSGQALWCRSTRHLALTDQLQLAVHVQGQWVPRTRQCAKKPQTPRSRGVFRDQCLSCTSVPSVREHKGTPSRGEKTRTGCSRATTLTSFPLFLGIFVTQKLGESCDRRGAVSIL